MGPGKSVGDVLPRCQDCQVAVFFNGCADCGHSFAASGDDEWCGAAAALRPPLLQKFALTVLQTPLFDFRVVKLPPWSLSAQARGDPPQPPSLFFLLFLSCPFASAACRDQLPLWDPGARARMARGLREREAGRLLAAQVAATAAAAAGEPAGTRRGFCIIAEYHPEYRYHILCAGSGAVPHPGVFFSQSCGRPLSPPFFAPALATR